MKKTKTQKGITLVALIITIIVLLILAVVAIGAVQNDGIINYAKNARTEYQAAQTNESTLLGNYTNFIEENTNTANIITFKILLVYGTNVTIECEAEEGMDFYTWSNSKYNKTNYKATSKNSLISYSDEDGYTYHINDVGEGNLSGDSVLGDDIIEADKTYKEGVTLPPIWDD